MFKILENQYCTICDVMLQYSCAGYSQEFAIIVENKLACVSSYLEIVDLSK